MSMTILKAVHVLVNEQGLQTFTWEEIRNQVGIEPEPWNKSCSPTFQGMRAEPACEGLNVGERFKNVFEQLEHSKKLLNEIKED